MIDEILNLIEKQEDWRGRRCLNLIPSENIMSPSVRRLLSSDFGHRYTSRNDFYMGTRFTNEIEYYGEKLAREIFEADASDLRPLSGHVADLIVLANLTKPGDTIIGVSPDNGGYPGLWNDGLAGLLRLNTIDFPFSKSDMNIEVEKAEKMIKHTKPAIVVFGASLMPFPHPVKELVMVAHENGAIVGYDGSHVLGLIAGRQFQDPLREGAEVLFGSTHKTFFGPQGGMILVEKELETIKSKIYPAFVDNAHWNRIAAMTLALAEMKRFGKVYALQVIRNAKTLARALHDLGFPVVAQHLGFTKSHQVILDYVDHSKARNVAERLQSVNIIVDTAIRVGTCEVTRHGMKESEMERIAELVERANDGEKLESVKNDVIKLVTEFQKVEYCFDK